MHDQEAVLEGEAVGREVKEVLPFGIFALAEFERALIVERSC